MIAQHIFDRYAQMRVPRYTSYPTAPNFSGEIGPREYSQWLSSLSQGSEISLYLHVPFCRAMCWYCGCHTSVTRRQAPVERYVDALDREIELVAERLLGRVTVRHLHWGGGSPTLLEPQHIARLDATLRRHFDFAADGELAVEVDPRTLTAEVAAAFAQSGINRASLGVQSFDPIVQQAINRVQSVEQTAAAVKLLRDRGVSGINFDLIYGLPHQTVRSCIETVTTALLMRPDRLAVFGYAHVPTFKPHQRNIQEAALPGPAERHAQSTAIADALVAAGYVQIGLDHFALPDDELAVAAQDGGLHRNFQGYTTDCCETLLGFGASAIGKLPQGFVQNSPNIPDYERRIAAAELAVTRGCPISSDDRSRAAIIERLMCDYRADADGVEARDLDVLERDGLLRRTGSSIEVPVEARPLVRTVAAAFDAYLPATAAKHVSAV